MVDMFGRSSTRGLALLAEAAEQGQAVEMENYFSRLTLDIIGKAVFNYEFNSLRQEDPVIQVIMQCRPERTPEPPQNNMPLSPCIVLRPGILRRTSSSLGIVHGYGHAAGNPRGCHPGFQSAPWTVPADCASSIPDHCHAKALTPCAGGVHGPARGGVPQHSFRALLAHPPGALGGSSAAALHSRPEDHQRHPGRPGRQVPAAGAATRCLRHVYAMLNAGQCLMSPGESVRQGVSLHGRQTNGLALPGWLYAALMQRLVAVAVASYFSVDVSHAELTVLLTAERLRAGREGGR